MRNLKTFENFQQGLDIDEICKKYGITNYTINDDGSIDVNGDVDLIGYGLTEQLPLSFNKVTGDFDCSGNKLISLYGCPKEVGKDFNCNNNQLTSLEFSPEKVGGNFSCGKNNLTSLVGCPKEVGGDFDCIDNDLTDLTGLDRFNGKFYCTGNPIESIFNEVEQYFTHAFQEYKVIKDDTVYLERLEYVMNQFHMDYDIEKIEVFYKIAEY